MQFKILVALLIAASMLHSLDLIAQKYQWDSTENWKIYQISEFKRVFSIPNDSLKYLKYTSLNDDSIHTMLSQSDTLEPGALWMGCYLLSFETSNGNIQKLVISQYGGFFYSPERRQYFLVKTDMKDEWLEYLSTAYMKFYKEK